MPSLNHHMARVYVTELAGGCEEIKTSAAHKIAYYLTKQQYEQAVASINKFWPDNYTTTGRTPMTRTTHLVAEFDDKYVAVTMVEHYLGGAHYGKNKLDRARKPLYYIQLEDHYA